jgi:hypothetical protein
VSEGGKIPSLGPSPEDCVAFVIAPISFPAAVLVECWCGRRLIVGRSFLADDMLAVLPCGKCRRVGKWLVVATDLYDYEVAELESD